MQSNELLNKVLVENIEKISGGVGAAVDFTLEQAPEVIQQALYWNSLLSLIECLFGVVYLVFLILISVKVISYAKTKDPRGEDAVILIVCGITFAGLLSVPAFVYINITWLKIWIAPKVWLIEYAASLIK